MKRIPLKSIMFFLLVFVFSFSLIQCKNSKEKNKDNKTNNEQTASTKPEKEKPKLVHDDNGNIVERHANSYRKKDGSLRSKDSYFYKYDERNNLIDETKISHNPEGEVQYKNVNFYAYNDLNQKIEQNFFSYDKNDTLQRQSRITYVYNDLGHLVEETSYFLDGSVKSIIIRDPNELGELNSEEYIHYNQDGTKKDHKKYYYTKYGLERTEDLMDK